MVRHVLFIEGRQPRWFLQSNCIDKFYEQLALNDKRTVGRWSASNKPYTFKYYDL